MTLPIDQTADPIATPIIGIDLGTTNSLIAVFEDGEPRLIRNALGKELTPSVVAIDDKGVWMVGEPARRRQVSHPRDAVALFKRSMGTNREFKIGDKTYRAEDLSAILLRNLKADAEAELGVPVTEAVVSVPAYFNETQRRAVMTACRLAELQVPRLINEPTAAALAYGLQDREAESTFVVFDLGGGTFDVSILEMFEGVMEVRSTAGDAFLGGEDFTLSLANHLSTALEREIADLGLDDQAQIQTIAEQAKRALSAERHVEISREIAGARLDLTLTRDQFEELNSRNLARLRRPLERALHDANLATAEVDRVVLVGGATRMPVIRSFVARQMQKLPEGNQNPDHVVALGAAIQAALARRDAALDDVVMTDVSAFTLGIDTSREVNGQFQHGFFMPIIERNSTVPISREEVVSVLHPGQTELEIRIFQGEAPLAVDNTQLGQLTLRVPRNAEQHESATVRFTYDISGLLEVEVTSVSSGNTERAVIQNTDRQLSEHEIESRLGELAALKIHPRDQSDVQLMIARLGEAYAMARGEERTFFQTRLAEFTYLVERQDKAKIDAAMSELDQILRDFETNYVR